MAKPKNPVDLTPEVVRAMFTYDPDTGALHWRIRACAKVSPGARAGSLDVKGYLLVMVAGRRLRAHRLAWAHFYGRWPDGVIDHRDGVRTNNRIANLRDVTPEINAQNVRKVRNRFGLMGVKLDARTGRFAARVSVNQRSRYLGLYDTPEAAHAAYIAAKRDLHPGFAG